MLVYFLEIYLKQQSGCKFDIADVFSLFFIVLRYIYIILISQYNDTLFLFASFSCLKQCFIFVKYPCTFFFHILCFDSFYLSISWSPIEILFFLSEIISETNICLDESAVFRQITAGALLAMLQLHLHSRINTWLQWIGLRQQQGERRNINKWRYLVDLY